jgi:hypothetical protein
MKAAMATKRPIPLFVKQMMSDEHISFDAKYLGNCIIDIWSAPGDLFDSWDIVPRNQDGTFDRAPNASYGPDAPEDNRTIRDFCIRRLWEITVTWDQNGWTKRSNAIYSDTGNCLCYKNDG